MYNRLFEKGHIGSVQIKNRIVMTAMTTGYASLDGTPTEQLCRYYEERAKGGVGLTGLETAELLFRNGEAESVTVVDMLEKIGANMYPSIFIDVTHQMEGKPLTLRAGMKLKEVTETGIICDDLANGKEETITADCVVLAMGIRSDNELIKQFEEAFDRVIPLGQTHRNPGCIATSMAEGYIAARGFDPKI